MKKLYVVKDGLKNKGCIVDNKGEQVKNTNYYLLTYGKGDEGYIKRKNLTNWRLYTQVGELVTLGKLRNKGVIDNSRARYYQFSTFEKCIEKLKELSPGTLIEICDNENFPLLFSSEPNFSLEN